jgi:hypothetical protein
MNNMPDESTELGRLRAENKKLLRIVRAYRVNFIYESIDSMAELDAALDDFAPIAAPRIYGILMGHQPSDMPYWRLRLREWMAEVADRGNVPRWVGGRWTEWTKDGEEVPPPIQEKP